MAKVHINVRVDSRNLERIDQIAEQQQTSRSAAVDQVLTVGLQQLEELEQHGGGERSPELIEAMRAHITTLHEQLAMKDAQIEQYGHLLENAQHVQARIIQALPESSQEQPAGAREGQEQPQDGHTSPQDAHTPPDRPQGVTTAPGQPQERKRGFWASLWS